MRLQTKVTGVIVLLVAVAALFIEYVEQAEIESYARQKFQDGALAVPHHLDANITSIPDLYDHKAREAELNKLQTYRPDLLSVTMFAFPAGSDQPPQVIVRSALVDQSLTEEARSLVQQVRESKAGVADQRGWESAHRLRVVGPIFLDGKVIGATYAEFSTAGVDEVLNYQARISLYRRIATYGATLLAINLFLYFQVHRPVQRLLSATEEIARGNMAATVPIVGRDELGDLATKFNGMMERVRSAVQDNVRLNEELQRMNEDLQARVNEAMAEILHKNQTLARTNELLSVAQRETERSKRLSAIGQLAATVAHKIGTPLTALSGHIQLLGEDPNLSQESRRRIHTVEAQIERTSKIIQDLLLYARRPDPVRSIVDLNACVEECLVLFQPELERRHIALVESLNPQVGKVEGDPQQLQELFNNLIENALDAMPNGGTLTVRSYLSSPQRPEGSNAGFAVEIADTGWGMDPEHVAQIFQPFFTTKRAGRGTGLGLAIVMETVRTHLGHIKVDSEVGKGSRFVVVLPAEGGGL